MAEIMLARLIILIGMVAFGFWIYKQIRKGQQEYKANHDRHTEITLLKETIETAQIHGGPISVLDLALRLEIPTEEAQRLLDKLVDQGVARTLVSDRGIIIYDIIQGDKPVSPQILERSKQRDIG